MSESQDWYLDEDFWRTFYPCMFNEETFAEGARQVPALLRLAGVEVTDVLDLGAGPGRHALPLARSGYRVTAVDTSGWLLEHLVQAATGEQFAMDVIQQDMREFSRPGSFDLVLLMWTSFGYFDDVRDHHAVLARVRENLRPGGRLVLDLVGLEYLCRNLQPVHLTEFDNGDLLIERPLLTERMTRLENEWLLVRDDRVRRAQFSHAVWSASGITALLQTAGFEVAGVYGALNGDDYDLDAERLIVIARPGGAVGGGDTA